LANPPQKSLKKVLALDRVNEVKTQPVTQEIRRGVTASNHNKRKTGDDFPLQFGLDAQRNKR
jgi:hypothetical protein